MKLFALSSDLVSPTADRRAIRPVFAQVAQLEEEIQRLKHENGEIRKRYDNNRLRKCLQLLVVLYAQAILI